MNKMAFKGALAKRTSGLFFSLMLLSAVLFVFMLSIQLVSAVTISSVGTMANATGWLFSQSTLSGIYYGFGWTNISSPASDIHFYNFATKNNTLIKSQTSQPKLIFNNTNDTCPQLPSNAPYIWGDTIYSAMIVDKIFLANLYYDYPLCKNAWDKNGLYAIDTKTNTFYLYDRLPFDFFVDNWPSPMTAVGSDLYFFVGIPDRADIPRRVYKYNTATKLTTNLTSLPEELGSGGIVFPVGTKIYITTYHLFGTTYYDPNEKKLNSIYVYDTLTNNFTYLNTSEFIPSNNYRSNSVVNGKLYFVGGEDPFTDMALNKIVEYDPSTNLFNITGTLSYGLLGASTTSLGGSLYVAGGEVHSDPAITDNILKIDIAEVIPVIEIEKSCPANGTYKSHGRYVSCVSKKAEEFLNSGLITEEQKDEIVSKAAKSAVGKRRK